MPRLLHQDAPHGLRRGAEEMAPTVPVLRPLSADEAQLRFVDQGRRLERLTGPFPGQPVTGEAPQLVLDQRQELLGGVPFALSGLRRDASGAWGVWLGVGKRTYSSACRPSPYAEKVRFPPIRFRPQAREMIPRVGSDYGGSR